MKKFLSLFLTIGVCLVLSVSVYAGDNQYGLNTHNFPNQHLNNQTLKNQLVNLGVKWIRAEIQWYVVEHIENYDEKEDYWEDFNFDPSDEIVRFAQQNDINIVFVLAYAPTWYGGHHNVYPSFVSHWQIYVREMVERYDGDGHKDMDGLTKPIKHWSLWNEPNLTQFWNPPTVFSKRQWFMDVILGPGMDALRDADPTAKICGPELSSGNDPKGWLTAFTNSYGKFDVLTHHQYDGGDNPVGRKWEMNSFYVEALDLGYGSEEFWITETGYKGTKFSHYTIGNYLVQWMDIMNSSSFVDKTFWYAWQNDAEGYGLLYNNFTPNYVYDIYKNYIQTH